MSWDDFFGTETTKASPIMVKVPQDKKDRDRCILAMAKFGAHEAGTDWDKMPGDDKLSLINTMGAALRCLERGEWEIR